MKIIFSDFDGTLTNDGKLGAIFFDIIATIEENNSELVIVSGRSLSWGHFLLTHFNFKYCIMEGGGVILTKNHLGDIEEHTLISNEEVQRLSELTDKLLQEIPGVVVSKDSFGRRTDRALEFSQMSAEDINETHDFFKKHNVNYSQSNVHINYWIGDISKANGVNVFLKNFVTGVSKTEVCFFGDAMNDESMFELFDNTIGVSNISEIIEKLNFKPSVVLEGKSNIGAFGVLNYLKSTIFKKA